MSKWWCFAIAAMLLVAVIASGLACEDTETVTPTYTPRQTPGAPSDTEQTTSGFQIQGWSVIDDNGVAKLTIACSASQSIELHLLGPDNQELDWDFVQAGESESRLWLARYKETPQPGEYTVQVRDPFGVVLQSIVLEFQGADLVVTDMDLKWHHYEYLEEYAIEWFDIAVVNQGDLPAYVCSIDFALGDLFYEDFVLEQGIVPGEQRTISDSTFISDHITSPTTPLITLRDFDGNIVATYTPDYTPYQTPEPSHPTETATVTPTYTPRRTPERPSYPIDEALALGLVEVDIEGESGLSIGGVSSGDVIDMGIRRKRPEEMEIVVPMGTLLINTDSSEQNMVIRRLKGRDPSILGYYPADQIVLDEDEWQRFLFEAYCLDMSKDNIYSSSSFNVREKASTEVLSMLEAADEVGSQVATMRSIQVALWVLTEDPTREELLDRYSADDQDINNARTILDVAGLAPESKRLFAGAS